ncbi:SMI1/KNR4 family protein [Pseudomonas sp. HN11]|uniref:SMI1/KNR4 family protein n=1 Tax=Pseudomonas sp. HN11 TaxID=1344094 RepID=UPI001F22E78B|nr:SMI1/KNR4 family protein [Pseudomonas sp. HN11]UII69818.1 SMI1/KNR4 family protein [Pseudomonas sp. HN11]
MEWNTYSPTHQPLSDDLVDGIEKVIRFKLPADYVECVKRYHGGQPKDRTLCIEVDGTAWDIGFGMLLTLDPFESAENIITALVKLREHHQLPEHYLPIVVGGGGDYLCFDYSETPASPKVVFYFHELDVQDGIFYVAESFTALLGRLIPDA